MSLSDDIIKVFKKKFIAISRKMPRSVDFTLLPDRVDIYVTGQRDGSYEWQRIIDDMNCNQDKSLEASVKDFIYDIRYDMASKGYFPSVVYRKFGVSPLDADKAMAKLLTHPDAKEIKDSDMFAYQLHTEKTFIVMEIDSSRSVVTLMSPEDDHVYRFKYPLTSLFKMKLQSDSMTPEELGYMLFRHATKLSTKPSRRGEVEKSNGCEDEE
ncbi:MAG: hypothetical protein LC687_04830 [Actinobacteria bacterium]|nr:hypothetical protein [Actinomycetota bacterium]MCA1807158.1 hypothetical protein [Actinomycetota bacterium]